jgi:TBP-interacting protein
MSSKLPVRELKPPPKRFERVGAHTHIKGLGLDENKRAVKIKDGMVGQEKAREAAGLIVEMIKQGKMSGRMMIIAGPPGTGKTALAVAISRELGLNVPFIQISGSEIYSTERKKTEVLIESLRRCIGVEIHENREVYEGEITKLEILTAPHPYNPYQKVPEGVRLTLKTTEEEKTLEAGAEVASQIIQQGIGEGYVIQIDAETGKVSALGLSIESPKGKTYDVDTRIKVSRPVGKVRKEKEFVYNLTLADLDEMMAKRRSSSLISFFFGGAEEKEISPEIRMEVDRQVKEWVDEGKAIIHPGVLFIDDAHLLDLEAFSFLGKAMEGELVPIIILATNRGIAKIRGTDIEAPLGFPLDLLDRAVIIGTEEYDRESVKAILQIRSEEEKVNLDEAALEALADIGEKTSLRYAVQILSIAAQHAGLEGRKLVVAEDVKKADELFMDIGEAVRHLKKYEDKLLKH